MLNLCNFIDRRTAQILAGPSPELFPVLINVNRQVAAGLLTQVATDPTDPTATGGGAVTA